MKVDATVRFAETLSLRKTLRMSYQTPQFSQIGAPCNELHRRRPSQEVYHRLRDERETSRHRSEDALLQPARRDH